VTVKTLGIDLSSMPPGTAVCLITWEKGRAVAGPATLGCDDRQLDALIEEADVIGVDAPLGWPAPFVAAVGEWTLSEWNEEIRDRFSLRETDRHVRQQSGVRPLSVSSDRIALPAMRAMALLKRHGVTDRSGAGRFFEVYPAGSLAMWQLTPKESYKKNTEESSAARRDILRALRRQLPWLEVPDSYADDADGLDSLLAALTARAAAQGLTHRPEAGTKADLARIEGWIHLPSGWPTP
jgi:predicted nuclease with RNAse H fold